MQIIKYGILSSLLISIVILSIFVYKKGIIINNTYHQEQYQNQSQSQIVVSMLTNQGSFEWKTILIDHNTNIIDQLNNLEPYQSLFAKYTNNYIVYPTITKKQ
jgi:hypothetical protein